MVWEFFSSFFSQRTSKNMRSGLKIHVVLFSLLQKRNFKVGNIAVQFASWPNAALHISSGVCFIFSGETLLSIKGNPFSLLSLGGWFYSRRNEAVAVCSF